MYERPGECKDCDPNQWDVTYYDKLDKLVSETVKVLKSPGVKASVDPDEAAAEIATPILAPKAKKAPVDPKSKSKEGASSSSNRE